MRKIAGLLLALCLGSYWAKTATTESFLLSTGAESGGTAAGTAEIYPAVRPNLAQGVLLVAGKNLLDPNFARTVILITDYGDRGAAGLVLNRRTDISAGEALPLPGESGADLEDIHSGGPVALNHIRILARGDSVPGGARNIIDNVFMVDTIELLKQMGSERLRKDDIRVYIGYAGWGAGQLEMELLHGDWYIWPAAGEVIFSKHPESIWHELIYLATAKWI